MISGIRSKFLKLNIKSVAGTLHPGSPLLQYFQQNFEAANHEAIIQINIKIAYFYQDYG